MERIYVHERIAKRHPYLSPKDVIYAWKHCLVSAPRLDVDPFEYLAIGIDRKGRLIELVAIRDSEGDWLIYHADTPPHGNARKELGFDSKGGQR